MKNYFLKDANMIIENDIIIGNLRIESAKISAFGRDILPNAGDIIVDCCGKYLSPGFIDIHIHGGNGSDFMDATEMDFETIACYHANYGTTSMLATTLTSSDEELSNVITCFDTYKKSKRPGANLLGLHLEGPYFSYEQRGAQDPKHLKLPTHEHFENILSKTESVLRISFAPELSGSDELIDYCKNHNIVLSQAHSSCTAKEAMYAFDRGANLVTHLYSGMNSVIRKNCYRVAGLVEAAYLIDDLKVEIICDGSHLPPELISLVYKIKGTKNIAVISDCSSASGTSGKDCKIGSRKNGQNVIIKDDVAFLPDFSAFAASVATGDKLLTTLISNTDIPLVDCIRMMTLTPAEILNIGDKKGKIGCGYDADIILFSNIDGKISVSDVFIMGEKFK